MMPLLETIGRPSHEFVAFAKTRLLQPGESQTFNLHFNSRDLCRYDESKGKWGKEDGLRKLQVAKLLRETVKIVNTS